MGDTENQRGGSERVRGTETQGGSKRVSKEYQTNMKWSVTEEKQTTPLYYMTTFKRKPKRIHEMICFSCVRIQHTTTILIVV